MDRNTARALDRAELLATSSMHRSGSVLSSEDTTEVKDLSFVIDRAINRISIRIAAAAQVNNFPLKRRSLARLPAMLVPKSQNARSAQRLLRLRNMRDRMVSQLALLRALLAPVRRLPPEILAEIVLFLIVLLRGEDEADELLVMNSTVARVCAFWRQVAYTTPRLWTHLTMPRYGLWMGISPTSCRYLERVFSI
ncbi:hypothetical protein EV121DRAFT_295984 [Schizophyllum commune]